MDEIWERAVETALVGEKEPLAARVLTLDGAVKCLQGHLPRPELLEKYQNLEHLSIASIGVSSLEQFPRLGKLQKLVLSDNRIAGGLENLVQAGLGSLRDLDLSNNRIHLIEDLVPLAELKLVSLDLYECPVTKMKDYRSRVFGLVKSLKYLDKMDAEENERPESEDEDEEEEEEEDDEEDEDDPGSCEIDGEEKPNGISNGHSERLEEVLEVDEEESEADEEETETGRQSNGVSGHDHANGLHGEESDDSDEEDAYEEDGPLIGDSQDSDEGDEDEDEEQVDNNEGHVRDSPRDIFGDFHGETGRQSNGASDHANGFQHVLMNLDEDDDSDGDDGLLVLDTEDMDEEGEYEDDGLIVVNTDDMSEEDGEEDEEELGNDVGDLGLPQRNELLRNSMVEEIDGHEQGEDDGESGGEDDDQGVDDGEEEDEEYVAELLARPVAQAIEVDEEVEGEEDYSDDDEVHVVYPIASTHLKRKRDDDDDGCDSVSDSSDNNNDDDDGSSDDNDDGGDDQ